MHDQYYKNNPDYDVLIRETETFIALCQECIEDGVNIDDYERITSDIELSKKFLDMIKELAE